MHYKHKCCYSGALIFDGPEQKYCSREEAIGYHHKLSCLDISHQQFGDALVLESKLLALTQTSERYKVFFTSKKPFL